MILRPTAFEGAFLVEPERREDERGFFTTTFNADEFAGLGLDPRTAQVGIAWNRCQGTLRGLHYQAEPHGQPKLVRCTRGAIFDVLADFRPGSVTRNRWLAVELTAENRLGLYVPEGLAHGYLTLTDDCEVLYQLATPWAPESERGVHYADPTLAIAWPAPIVVVSARDAALPRVPAEG